MKVGIIVSDISSGGAQRVAIGLSAWLNEHDCQADVLALRSSSKHQYDTDGVSFVSLEALYPQMKIGRRLRAQVMKENYDVCVVMGVPMCVYVIPALRGLKTKIVVSERNDPRHFHGKRITKWLSRRLMRRADGFVFQTPDALAFYQKKLRGPAQVIPNPLTADLPTADGRDKDKAERRVVTAGRLVAQKNHRLLIEAFAKAAKKTDGIGLTVFGEGSLLPQLRQWAQTCGVADRVSFPGAVDDLPEKIRDAALFVLSSDFEGMPNALMEAMAMGLPCVSTDCPCGGPRELIQDGVNGLLVPVNDADRLAQAITRLMEDRALARSLGENARRVRDDYGMDVIAGRWLAFLQSVMSIGNGGNFYA
ncbi:MAG: glycosyltransferase [Acutalibacteraceae bacterium]|jgi:glycosyltransferase involved in cell wall biosynthesis